MPWVMKEVEIPLYNLALDDLEGDLFAKFVALGLSPDLAKVAARQVANDPDITVAARKAAN